MLSDYVSDVIVECFDLVICGGWLCDFNLCVMWLGGFC